MSQIRITTFNVENLFSRYRLLDRSPDGVQVQLLGVTSIDYQGRPLSEATTQLQRNNTARAILESRPDILAVAEVENLWTLRCFNDEYLSGYFDRLILLEGNDGRGINVGLCLRAGATPTLQSIRTHVDDLDPNSTGANKVERYYSSSSNQLTVLHALFSRDCLEVDIDADGKLLTLLVNHLKAQDGNTASEKLRTRQATRVAQIVQAVKARGRLPIVLGDLNANVTTSPTLKPLMDLVNDGVLSDPFKDIADSWTHFYDITQENSRLDFILPDASLPIASATILREGVSLKCTVAGERFPTMGYVATEASDHCPVTVTLAL